MSLTFAKRTFTLVRGTTWTDTFRLYDDSDPDAPVNLTGATLTMRIRSRISGPILADLTTDNAKLAITNAGQGEITVAMSAAETRTAFPEAGHRKAKYVYDLVIQRPGDVIEPGVSGKVVVLPQITRPWSAT